MRVALIADIHGNLLALEAVLTSLARADIDALICLGDVAATGPQPHEVIARLRELGCPCILGNADADLLNPPPHPQHAAEPTWLAIDRWCAAQLTAEDRSFLGMFRPIYRHDLGDRHTLLSFHGSPRSYDEQIHVTTSDIEIEAMLAGHDATIVAGGHTHAPFIRTLGHRYLVNPGSVGLRPPHATYALVDSTSGTLDIELRVVPLPIEQILSRAQASGMPEYEWWSSHWT